MSSALSSLGAIVKNFAMGFWRLPLTTRIASIVAILLICFGGSYFFGSDEAPQVDIIKQKAVSVRSVASLSLESTPLPLLGTVTSRSEATIRAEGSGKIAIVYKSLGDYVSAGQVIAEFDNAGERAQVLQAEGAYRGAEAGGDIATINKDSTGLSLSEAKIQAQNALASVYTTLDDAVRTKTDSAWNNPQTRNAKFIVTVSDSNLVIRLEQARVGIESMLRARESKNKTLTPESDLIAELNLVEAEARLVRDYLDDLSTAFTRAIPDGAASQSAIDGYKANTGVARGVVSGSLSLITSTRNALNGSIAVNQVAETNATRADNGGVSTSDAGLMSALGNLRAAQARLEKTIIRSPINGTINSFSISTGDFISPFTQVAVVSNNGALEILSYVTEDDARELAVGTKVTLEESGNGIITRISPALDPKTKKIEVRIGILKTAGTLLNGQSIHIGATRSLKENLLNNELKIPLSSLKITPQGSIVFTVSGSSTLIAHPVKEGSLLGEYIEIEQGLTPDMNIVVDARGLKVGAVVTVLK